MRIVARLISTVFHPLIMPTLGLFIILKAGTFLSYMPNNLQRILMYIMVSITLFIPVFLMPFFYLKRFTEYIKIGHRYERTLPVLISMILFTIGFLYFRQINAPLAIQNFTLSIAIISLIASVLIYFWNICLHMTGIGGLISLLIVFCIKYLAHLNDLILVLVFISGVLASSRLYLNEKNIYQVIGGFSVGIIVLPIIYFLF